MKSSFVKSVLVLSALLLVGWALFVSWQQMERHARIEEEVAALEAEAEKIRRENETFAERISYFSSDAFREQEAKKKLGLKKVNESVVVIKPTAASNGPDPAATAPAVPRVAEGERENYRKWLELFID